MKDDELFQLSARLGAALKEKGKFITCAESCTGGWIAKTITDTSGSAGWFDRGFVTYGNQAKSDMLGVKASTLEHHGAVSDPVVLEMAQGALAAAGADYAVAVSGIAGPDGGTIEKPVGTVWFGFAARHRAPFSQLMHFDGGRDDVRRQAVHFALKTLLDTFF
ncbi:MULTISPECIES: nicotinamide-nucleotide amidase [Sodalis]|jgi:nicotinamide-nucleotide amidase|uniref:Nicotinamide-nucleotide amidase n=1 Tax=Sodalis ligni TaxID=2697027 RepID=A0A4R1NQH6_9GAMM|nr:nicotinamide-nucleotide amidase [Sodalis ligni]TCL06640.1 nicotinamide-nucleotide amidase [Sodalis ligni]